MSIKFSILRFRVKLRKKLKINPKFTPDEEKAIALVKGLANNPATTILSLPGDKMVAFNGKVYIRLEYKKMDIADGDEYFEIELDQKSSERIYQILSNILNSRIRQVEKRILLKKEEMLNKMINDANQKNNID